MLNFEIYTFPAKTETYTVQEYIFAPMYSKELRPEVWLEEIIEPYIIVCGNKWLVSCSVRFYQEWDLSGIRQIGETVWASESV